MFQINLEKGTLHQTPILSLFKHIYDQNESGCLTFSRGEQTLKIYFREGSLITVESDHTDKDLIDLLYHGGLIEDDDLDNVTELVKKYGWNDEKVETVVDQSTQKWHLRILIREFLLTLFDWFDGDYSFTRAEAPSDRFPIANMNTLKLLLSLLDRIQNIDVFVNLIGGYHRVLAINTEGFTKINQQSLTPEDGFYLSRIDGKLNIRDVLAMGGGKKREMAGRLAQLLLKGCLIHEPESEKKYQQHLAEQEQKIYQEKQQQDEQLSTDDNSDDQVITEESSDTESALIYVTDEVVLTDEELVELRKLAKNLDSDFLDLAKALHLQQEKGPEDVGYDVDISYQRGDKFVDAQSGGVDVDSLARIGADGDYLSSLEDDDRIAFIIDGKVVDGESELFGADLTRDILEIEDEEEQWNLWMISEEELSRDFDKDWTSTWSDWVENTAELSTLQHKIDEMEARLKAEADEKAKDKLLNELKKQNVEFQDVIRKKKREMFAIHRRMQIMTYYELLRIERDASQEEIEEAYIQWQTHLLPDDTFIREFSSMAPQIAQVVEMMQNAHSTLSDVEKRKVYDEELQAREKMAVEVQKKKKLLAEQHLLSARIANRRGDKMLAMRFVRGSISLDPENAVYYHEMAKLLAENVKWRKQAIRFFHRAYHLAPDNTDILIEVADLVYQLDLSGFAIRVLKQALKQDPNNIKAKRMLRKIQLSR